MKKFNLFIGFLCFVFVSFGQEKQTRTHIQKAEKISIEKIKDANRTDLFYGEYVISNYYPIMKKSLPEKKSSLLINSIIKLESNRISGEKISAIDLSVYEIEKMKQDDFLFRVFGDDIKFSLPEDFPKEFNVHKVENNSILGLISIQYKKIAFVYQGGIIVASAG